MKKILLSLAVAAFAMTASAQTFIGNETGWTQNWNSTSDCANTSGGVGNMDNNSYVSTNYSSPSPSFNSTEKAVQIVSNASITSGSMAGWNGFLYNDGTNCDYMRNVAGVNMSGTGKGKIAITAKASNAGAVLRIYLGTTGTSGWSPTSSTYNTGSGSSIIAEFTLTTSYAVYTFDYEATDPTVWGAWAGRSSVNQWGFDPQTASTTYYVQRIDIGGNAASTTSVDNNAIGIYPNPASTEVNVDFTGMDQNGATAKLINASGIVVFEGSIGTTFSVAGYNKGIYMLQVTSGNKVASKKLVIE